MSLIYQSLQETAKTDGQGAPRHPLVHRPPRGTGFTGRLAIFLTIALLLCAAAYGVLWWLRGELQRLEPRRHSAANHIIDEAANATLPGQSVTNLVANGSRQAPTALPESNGGLPPLSLPPRPNTPTQTKIGIEDLVKPTMDLERLFVQRANRNQRIMELDKQLATAWEHPDPTRQDRALAELTKVSGADSVLVRKWRGALALRRGEYAKAERLFSRLAREKPTDVPIRINYIQTLLGLREYPRARQEWRRLDSEHPNHAVVRDLLILLQQGEQSAHSARTK